MHSCSHMRGGVLLQGTELFQAESATAVTQREADCITWNNTMQIARSCETDRNWNNATDRMLQSTRLSGSMWQQGKGAHPPAGPGRAVAWRSTVESAALAQ